MIAVTVIGESGNSKLTDDPKEHAVSATYLPQRSCPPECVFRNSGCYAENGNTGFTTNRLNRDTDPSSRPVDIAKEESKKVFELATKLAKKGIKGRPIRYRVVGDSYTKAAAIETGRSADIWADLVDGKAWTYTHGWRRLRRSLFGDSISVLASVEKTSQIAKARSRGFAAAIVVPYHKSDKVYKLDGEKILPCPHQTRGTPCVKCKLCWDDKRLLSKGISIGFAVHGSRSKAAKHSLTVMQ